MPTEVESQFDSAAVQPASHRPFVAEVAHLWWLARDVVSHFKRDSFVVLILNLVATVAGAAAIGALIVYARFLESGTPVKVAGMTIEPSQTTTGILVFSAVMAALGLCSGVCLYFMQWLVGRMAVRYWRLCVQRLVHVAADPAYAGWASFSDDPPTKVISDLSGRTSRMAAMVMRRMVLVMRPLIVFFVSAACLLIVSPLLTALLIPLMLAYLIPLYRIMRGATHYQARYLESSRKTREGLREFLKAITGSSLSPEQKMELAARSVQTPERELTGDLFNRRRLADDRMRLLNTTFFILCVQVLFVFFAIESVRNGHHWSELLLYIVALRFVVTELRQVTSTLVFISRLLPFVVPYYRFMLRAEGIKAVNEQRSHITSPLPDEFTISREGEGMWNSAASLVLKRGSIVWVLRPGGPSHSDLEAIVLHIERNASQPLNLLSRCGFLAGDDVDERVSAHLHVNGQPDSATVERWSRLGVADELHDALNGNSKGGVAQHVRSLSAEARLALTAAPLLQSSEMRIISAAKLRGVDEQFVEQLLCGGISGYTILVARKPRLALDPSFDLLRRRIAGVMVIREGRIVACGDLGWLTSNLNPIRAALTSKTTESDDLDMDMDESEEDDMDF